MSIEKITARILQEAQDEAKAVQAAAEAEQAAVLARAEEEAKALTARMQQKAEEDARVLKERRLSVAELEARKLRLAAKQELIEEAFTEAMYQLADMKPEDYKAFILEKLKPYMGQPGEIILNARDQKNLTRELRACLTDSPSMDIAEETADIRGGFILRQGCVSINASLEKLLDQERQAITAQIAETLFS